MKMILASKEKFLLDRGYDLLGIPSKELKIGIINTAFQTVENQAYIEYMHEYYALMSASGLDFKQFDITGKTEEEIVEFFADRNVVQVTGGNAFYLLKAVQETGFGLILKKLLESGRSYIGCSSGSYLMCPTVEVAGWKVDRNRYGVTDYTALNYVPFLLKCHYTDDQKDDVAEKAKTLKHPLRLLRDDQCILIEDGKMSFIGSSEEARL